MICLRASALTALLALTGSMSGVAIAQNSDEFKPQDFSVVDERGVDLADRTLTVSHSISIGDPREGGLSYTLSHTSPGTWRAHQSVLAFMRLDVTTDDDTGTVYNNRTLKFEGKTELMEYTGTGSVYAGELGSHLTECGNWCATAVLADGTTLAFDTSPLLVSQTLDTSSYILRVTSAQKPNGEKLNFHYLGSNSPYIRSLTNNHGYQLRFIYSNENTGSVTSMVLFNMAVDPCSPAAATCPPFSRTWPRLSIAGVSGTTVVTDTSGAQTVYSYGGGPSGGLRIEHIDRPGNDDTQITYQNCGSLSVGQGQCSTGGQVVGNYRVQTVTRGGRTWTYEWDPSLTTSGMTQHGVKVTHAAGNVGYTTQVAPMAGNGYGDLYGIASRLVRIRDERGRTTVLEHAGHLTPMLSKVTYPEGNGEEYTYLRGSITQIRRFAKPGSGLSDRTISIKRGEPGGIVQCTQPAYCNKPVLIRDARGYVTRNTWHPTSGQLMSTETGLQGPDNNLTCSFGTNLCPVTSYGYTSLNAHFYNASGQMAAGTPAILKRTSKTQCETASTCAATAQVVTTMG